MPALRTLLPHLGLFLCLALCFSPSFSLSNNESCILYDKVYPSDNLINATAEEVSGENTTYTGESKPLVRPPFVLRGALTRPSDVPYVGGHDGKWGAGIDMGSTVDREDYFYSFLSITESRWCKLSPRQTTPRQDTAALRERYVIFLREFIAVFSHPLDRMSVPCRTTGKMICASCMGKAT